MDWRPQAPKNLVQLMRNGEMRFLGVITNSAPAAGDAAALEVSTESYEALIADLPLPFTPPGADRSYNPDGFALWWRQLMYVFDFEDPLLAPPLPAPLAVHELHKVERFIHVAQELAASRMASATGGFVVTPERDGRSETVVTDFPSLDAQIGFAALLRQCNSTKEAASYNKVTNVLWRAADAAVDAHRDERLVALRAWHVAVEQLRKSSLDQLLRRRFVESEGWTVFDWVEPQSPEQLLSTFNYGDLLHWGEKRERIISPTDDELDSALQRHNYMKAALGLAHTFIGFAHLARALTTPHDELLLST